MVEKKREKEKHAATFGWQSFTQEATFRAYEKRLSRIPKQESQDVPQAVQEVNELDYGKLGNEISTDGLERLKRDVEERVAARGSHHRRRRTYDASTVDGINERNAFFNKKLKRSFDKYTVEIRQNLERGTAI